MKNKFKNKFKNVPGDIMEIKLRDWYGHTFYRNKVNTADKGSFAISLKTAAEFGGLNIEIKGEHKDLWMKRVKQLMEEDKKKEREKIREYFKKD